jgi:hypothetical protein
LQTMNEVMAIKFFLKKFDLGHSSFSCENKVMLKTQIAARAGVSCVNVMDLSILCSISHLIRHMVLYNVTYRSVDSSGNSCHYHRHLFVRPNLLSIFFKWPLKA